jgi:hypothetical protein
MLCKFPQGRSMNLGVRAEESGGAAAYGMEFGFGISRLVV